MNARLLNFLLVSLLRQQSEQLGQWCIVLLTNLSQLEQALSERTGNISLETVRLWEEVMQLESGFMAEAERLSQCLHLFLEETSREFS